MPHITTTEIMQPDHWLTLKTLRLAALTQDPDAFGSTLAREQGQPEAFWRARIESAAANILACVDGVPAGLTTLAYPQGHPDAWIYGVWVAPHARGCGLGEALMQEAARIARCAGAQRLLLEVADTNAPAIALYARLGFEITGNTSHLAAPREHITEHERALTL